MSTAHDIYADDRFEPKYLLRALIPQCNQCDKTGVHAPSTARTVVTRSSSVPAGMGVGKNLKTYRANWSPEMKRRIQIGVLDGPNFAMRNAS